MARRRDVRVARANAALQFGPQRQGLNALIRAAKSEYKTDVDVAEGMAKSAVASARASRKPLRQIYNRAQAQADRAHGDVEAAFGRIGSGASDWQAVTAREFGLEKQRTADAAAAAQRETVAQANEARLGRLGARSAARERYLSTLGDIRGQAQGLRKQRGQYVAAQVGEVQAERRKSREERRLTRLKAKLDGAVTPQDKFKAATQLDVARVQQSGGGGGGGGGKSDYTPLQVREAYKDLRKATSMIRGQLKGRQYAPSEDFFDRAFNDLVKYEDFDPAIARAAAQLTKTGKVGPEVRKLLRRDYGITSLPNIPALKKLPKYTPSQPGNAPGPAGQGPRRT